MLPIDLDIERFTEKDRVLIKSSGEPTYRMADIAYHWHKAERGFDLIIGVGFVLGNYLREIIRTRTSGTEAGRNWIGSVARVAVLIFALTMAIQQLEVAPTFVLLTFGLLLLSALLGVLLPVLLLRLALLGLRGRLRRGL